MVNANGSNIEITASDTSGTGAAQLYSNVLPEFFRSVGASYTKTMASKEETDTWNNPTNTPESRWRFAAPLGLRMTNIASVQFFHFPPLRLVETSQDYLCDPVPYRWQQLTVMNQIAYLQGKFQANPEAYETIVDSKPIAAPDNAGKYISRVPEKYFTEYQQDLVNLWLTTNRITPGVDHSYTIPIVVLGIQPMATFEDVFGANLSALSTQTVPCTKEGEHGPMTAVLGAGHPYRFYVAAQLNTAAKGLASGGIGGGLFGPMKEMSQLVMMEDLIAAGWQVAMAEDPSANADQVLADVYKFWTDPAQKKTINALVLHQGSYVTTSEAGKFGFTVSWADALNYCTTNSDPFSYKCQTRIHSNTNANARAAIVLQESCFRWLERSRRISTRRIPSDRIDSSDGRSSKCRRQERSMTSAGACLEFACQSMQLVEFRFTRTYCRHRLHADDVVATSMLYTSALRRFSELSSASVSCVVKGKQIESSFSHFANVSGDVDRVTNKRPKQATS